MVSSVRGCAENEGIDIVGIGVETWDGIEFEVHPTIKTNKNNEIKKIMEFDFIKKWIQLNNINILNLQNNEIKKNTITLQL